MCTSHERGADLHVTFADAASSSLLKVAAAGSALTTSWPHSTQAMRLL